MKSLKLSTILISTLIVLASCAEDGAPGSIGPPGPQGEKGEQGPQGDPGALDAIYSDWFDITVQDWSGLGGTLLNKKIDVPEISQDIIDKGMVLVYHRFDNETKQLPYFYSASGIHLTFKFVPLELTIQTFLGNGNKIGTIAPLEFRYVVIPGGSMAGGRSSLDYSDYQAVKVYFGIPD